MVKQGGGSIINVTSLAEASFGPVFEDISDNNPGTFPGKEPRLLLTHPVRGAGNDRDFVLQTHRFPPHFAVRESSALLPANRSSHEKECCDDRGKRRLSIPSCRH